MSPEREDQIRETTLADYEQAPEFAAANIADLLAEIDRLRQAQTWIPVEKLLFIDYHEWHHLLFPDNTVGNGAYMEVNDEEERGYADGDYAWCGWEDDVYRALSVQPTHFHPLPQAPPV